MESTTLAFAFGLVIATSSACVRRAGPELCQPVGTTTVTAAARAVPDRPRPTSPPPPAQEPRDERGCELPSLLFAPASANVTPQHNWELNRIARCLTVGALAGAGVIVIGRADPTGAPLDNLDLGLRRAVRVREFLVAQGVPPERVVATSAGDRASEAVTPDRRVDLLLTR